ncbi:YaiO family outer membrane beta-barrel protein [Phenylobacterium sp.]|uniref:YaiO family outer membrane beta-barrel protein n=1 Tax=Phenylobacterium sp. TaxID=1871053 RepID=UPI003982E757
MRTFLLGVVLVLAASAAHAQAPESAPTTGDSLARGSALRASGRAAEAVPLLEAAIRESPADADAWLNLGLAYTATGRYDDAERVLDYALRLSPDYADAHVARARLAFFREDLREARRRLAPALAARPQNPDALALQAQLLQALAAASARWRLDANVNTARLSDGLPAARGVAVFLGRTFEGGLTLSGGIERQRQFGATDTYLEGQFGHRLGYLALGGTAHADFRPEASVRGGLYARPRSLGAGWTAQAGADAGWSRYAAGDVRTLTPLITLARGEALTLTARWINVLDETDTRRSGYGLAAAFRPRPRLQLLAGWTDAPESSDGVTVDVQAVSLGVAVDVAEDFTLRLGGTREIRRAYDREDVSAGLTRRF